MAVVEPVVIAADLGGTLLRTGVVRPPAAILHQDTIRIEDRRGNAPIEALLRVALEGAVGWARKANVSVGAAGLAAPGLVDPARGLIRYSANLDVRDLAVGAIVREVVDLPTVVENDVRAAAWAEWAWGAGRGTTHLAYLSAGTGIAAALVSEGRLYYGAAAAAGELGHVPVVSDGDPCRCGHTGCLETIAGGWGIARRAERMMVGAGTEQRGAAQGERLSAERVFQAAARGDTVAGAIIEEAGVFMGRAAVSLVRLWNPERLVLGGGLFFEGSPLVVAVHDAVGASALYGDVPPPVILATFGGSSGLIGAAGLAQAALGGGG